MKAKFIYVAAAAVIAAGCSQEQENAPTPQFSSIISASLGGPQTRSAIDDTEYADGRTGVLWTPGDEIGVFGQSSKNFRFVNLSTANAGRTKFGGDIPSSESLLYAYYPYSAEAGTDPAALRGMLPLRQTYDPQTGLIEGDYKTGRPRKGADDEFDFTHLFSLFRITVDASGIDALEGDRLRSVSIQAPDGRALGGNFTFSALDGTYTLDGGTASSSITLEWASGQPLADGARHEGFLSCAPSIKAGDKLTITVATDRHTATFTREAAYDFAPDAIYVFDLTLSRYAPAIEELPEEPEEETANCYMITSAGEHDFKATVIGNGEKGIIKGAGFHTENPYINPSSARLLWEDTKGFISKVELRDGRVHYTTTGHTGNALIAVCNDAGEILWSWHIWGVGPTLPQDEELTNFSGHSFTVMDRNLGAFPSTEAQRLETTKTEENEARVLHCMLYQWGRKDPFPNSATYYVGGKAVDISSSYPLWNPPTAAEATILASIRRPDMMIGKNLEDNEWRWLAVPVELLWGNSKFYGQNERDASHSHGKTIYDPSPVGYRVANPWTFTGFSGKGNAQSVKGGLSFRDDGTPTMLEQIRCVLDYWTEGSNNVKRWTMKGFHKDRIGYASDGKTKIFGYGGYYLKNALDTEGSYIPRSGSRVASSGSRSYHGVNSYIWADSQGVSNTDAGYYALFGHTYYLVGSGNYKEPDKGLGRGDSGTHTSINPTNTAYPWVAHAVRCVRE